jgi:hypothetical protein
MKGLPFAKKNFFPSTEAGGQKQWEEQDTFKRG